jgi:3-hydroxyisobutyrate dehydrogenase-like beta-hydroxyacid dehydrogenase
MANPEVCRTVGIIGLGLVGSALVEVLHRHGRQVVGYDICPEKTRSLSRYGMVPADSTLAVAKKCRCMMLSLPDAGISRTVLTEMQASLRPGDLIIDTTTGDPQAMAALCAILADQQVDYLEATIGGSSEQLRHGQVVIMVGGEAQAFARVEPLLQLLTSDVFYMGESGQGAQAKLIFNLALGLHRAVLAEALNLGERAGMDLNVLLQLLRAGGAYSRVMDTKGPKMVSGEYSPVARLRQHLKDVRLMQEFADRVGAPLPLTDVHRELLQAAEEGGMGEWDNAAIFELYRKS